MNETIHYGRQSMKVGLLKSANVYFDVRRFVTHSALFSDWLAKLGYSKIIREQYQDANLFGEKCDLMAWKMQCLVKNSAIYGPDTFWGAPEHWLLPEQTFEAIRAKAPIDCEDGANYLASLIVSLGIPEERVWVSAGEVDLGSGKLGGHAYVVYQRYIDDRPCVYDWCYWEDTNLVTRSKPTFEENDKYKNPWFSYNSQNCWVETKVELNGRVRNITK